MRTLRVHVKSTKHGRAALPERERERGTLALARARLSFFQPPTAPPRPPSYETRCALSPLSPLSSSPTHPTHQPAAAVVALFGSLVLAFFAVNVALWWAANASASSAAAAARRKPKAASKKKMKREAMRRGAMQVLGD